MKYWIFSDKKWNYEDLEDETIALFSSPNDFDFLSLDSVKDFVKSKKPSGLWKLVKDDTLEYYEHHQKVHSPGYSMIFSASDLIYNSDFVEYLKTTHKVKLLKSEPLIDR